MVPFDGASNAMLWPSGDQRGVPALSVVLICTGSEPSSLLIQICHGPERFDMKAIRFPSGENCGAAFPASPEMIVRNSAVFNSTSFSGRHNDPGSKRASVVSGRWLLACFRQLITESLMQPDKTAKIKAVPPAHERTRQSRIPAAT